MFNTYVLSLFKCEDAFKFVCSRVVNARHLCVLESHISRVALRMWRFNVLLLSKLQFNDHYIVYITENERHHAFRPDVYFENYDCNKFVYILIATLSKSFRNTLRTNISLYFCRKTYFSRRSSTNSDKIHIIL